MNSLPFHVATRLMVSNPAARQTSIRPLATASYAAWKHSPPVAPPHSIRTEPFGLSPR